MVVVGKKKICTVFAQIDNDLLPVYIGYVAGARIIGKIFTLNGDILRKILL